VNAVTCTGKAADVQRWATASIIFVEAYGNSAGGKLSVTKWIPNEKSQLKLATVPLYLLHMFALVGMFRPL
jgi:uncharacterized membrane protein YoaT (DUF817 family)